MKQTQETALSSIPIPKPIEEFPQNKPDSYHMIAADMKIEFRYNTEASSLQEKMIKLCQQMI